MKKLFLLLFLLIPLTAWAQVDGGYWVVPDCATLNPVTNGTVCLQSTTTGGRSAGTLYIWNGSAWTAPTGGTGTPGAPDTSVQFNASGTLAGDAGMTYNSGTNVLTVTGDILVGAQSVCQENGTNCPAIANETDSVVGAVSGVVKSNGKATFAAASATDLPNTPAGSIAANTVQGALNELDTEKQPVDADLTAISALACIGGAYRTAANTWNCRTIIPVSGEITVSSGDGVAGNPAIGLGADAVKRNQANTYSGGGLQDFTLSTIKIPNAAGYAPTAHGLAGINNTTNEVSIGVNGTNKKFIFQGDPVLGVATALAADPAGCILANGEWTNDINASGVSNCIKVIQSAAATPSAGTSRYPGDLYADTRAFACATGAGRIYRASTVGGNFSAVAGESDNVTTFQGQSGAWTVCGAGTLSILGSGGFTTAATGTFGNPGIITINPPTPTDDTVMVGSGTTWVGKLLPNCATALTYDTATNAFGCGGGGGGGTPPGGTVTDIQFNDGAGAFAGGRCTMDAPGDISCAGGITTGTAAVASGSWTPSGVTSGSATIGVADAAGTPARINLPLATAAANGVLTSDGGTPQQTRWDTVPNLLGATVFSISQLPQAARYRPCEIVIGDPGAASAVLADDNDSPSNCKNTYGATLTITSVNCYAPVGAPTVTPIITGGGATSIVTGALTCTNAAGGALGTLTGTPTQAANGTIDVNITTAGGAAKYIVIYINRSL